MREVRGGAATATVRDDKVAASTVTRVILAEDRLGFVFKAIPSV